jgi:hypothetical protein
MKRSVHANRANNTTRPLLALSGSMLHHGMREHEHFFCPSTLDAWVRPFPTRPRCCSAAYRRERGRAPERSMYCHNRACGTGSADNTHAQRISARKQSRGCRARTCEHGRRVPRAQSSTMMRRHEHTCSRRAAPQRILLAPLRRLLGSGDDTRSFPGINALDVLAPPS